MTIEVLGEVGVDRRGRKLVRTRCSCGNERVILKKSLSNRSTSCGCERANAVREATKTHGQCVDDAHTPEYEAWRTMLARCDDPSRENYPYYGGRGIGVCARWRGARGGFEAFLADVGQRPTDGHVLCLLDKSKDYAPGNAAWLTRHDADRKKRNNTFYEVNGVTKCLVDWAKEHDIPKNTLHYRVVTKGMSMRDALDVGRGCQGKVLPT